MQTAEDAGVIKREWDEHYGRYYWAICTDEEMITDGKAVKTLDGREADQGELYRHANRFVDFMEKQHGKKLSFDNSSDQQPKKESLTFGEVKQLFNE
jgi:hypothetical protein